MLFDNGTTQITHDPVALRMYVGNSVELAVNAKGGVIAASLRHGRTLQRRREIELVLTDAERTALESFFGTVGNATFLWTDSQSRVWDAWWLGGFTTQETANVGVGHHRIRLSLVLESINDDTGRTAYGNTDVSQMSIQKSGGSVLYFPLAYHAPATDAGQATNRREYTGQFVASDPNRRTSRTDRNLAFVGMADDFIEELEDYFVSTLVGATHPFSMTHFRDTTTTYRWTGACEWELGRGFTWRGNMALREEV